MVALSTTVTPLLSDGATAIVPSAQARELRNALGLFTTGVCVVTTADRDGHRAGLTVNSFTSVSLSPPLVAWCLRNDSASRPAFAESGYFAVHILGSGQRMIANHFARPHQDKFGELNACVEAGVGNVPVIPGTLAHFECRKEAMQACGDHFLLIGRVEHFRYGSGSPLLFHAGHLLPCDDFLAPDHLQP